MNAVEIEQAITDLAEQPFDLDEFPYAFLEAFGNKTATIKRLRAGDTNKSDLGGVLQTNHVHIFTCDVGDVPEALAALKESPATNRWKAKLIIATDGQDFEAEDLSSGETLACPYKEFPNHFGFFLGLAGISTIEQIKENAFDIRATSRLNRLYVQLLKDNPDWDTAERRLAMNTFMARLIFCFFAEDTQIFAEKGCFIQTIQQMSAPDSSNTHEVISALFQVMDTKHEERAALGIPRWADSFPYVNGHLFDGADEVPRFSKVARSYLLHVGSLDWTKINPDIFGSMIQAITEDEERGSLGMHYTSVPNILKVLNPLFLDDVRAKLEQAGSNVRALTQLRKRLSRIRVFDPACGSGNFLVIAYKEMRAIEGEINKRLQETRNPSVIPLTNFRGIELRHFPSEIARLALVIAEFQCDVLHRDPHLALAEFLPLKHENWIVCGNALRLDWLSICPPTGKGVSIQGDDLFAHSGEQAEVGFENEGGETYICGNPPYLGSTWQNAEQKSDLKSLLDGKIGNWKSLDYVAGWFFKAVNYCCHTPCVAAFVSTNSICQGQQVPILWPFIFSQGCAIDFAYTSFKWANLAAHNAGVTVAIIAISKQPRYPRRIFETDSSGTVFERQCENINAYLVAGGNVIVNKAMLPLFHVSDMSFGSKAVDGGGLILTLDEVNLSLKEGVELKFIRKFVGSRELIQGNCRFCIWVTEQEYEDAKRNVWLNNRFSFVREQRLASSKKQTRELAIVPYRFSEIRQIIDSKVIVVPKVSSENREYLPCGYEAEGTIISDLAFALYDAPLWNMALIASRLHLVWIATVCGKMKTDFRYSNTLGWNTFPVPTLTAADKAELTRCAEEILLARERHFPKTIADLYAKDSMPEDLRAAHARNDEVLERIYIGRRFKNDSERLETLFGLYTNMTASAASAKGSKRKAGVKS